jgi:hypothetical protein
MIPAKGDMITVDMKILGDPHFIKQDDLFYYQTAKTYNQQFISSDTGSSLYMDGNELYVFLNFESPVDYDESLGLALKTDRYRYSEFSGVYKVITVENVFQKGMFTQVLNLVKLFYDQDGKEIPSIYQRIDTIAQNQLLPTARIQSARYAGPNVNLAALRSGQIQNVQTAIQSTVNRAAGLVQSSSIIGQIGQQVVGQAIGKVVSAGIGKGIQIASKSFSELTSQFKSVPDFEGAGFAGQLSQATADFEGAGFAGQLSQATAESIGVDYPDSWSEFSDFNSDVDLGDLNSLDLGDINNLDIGFEF